MAKKAYPCIGGPLDGKHAVTDDFSPEWGQLGEEFFQPRGMYHYLADEYMSYNNANGRVHLRRGTVKEDSPSMIFVHVSCLKPAISPKDR
jgi:hypothetical protein